MPFLYADGRHVFYVRPTSTSITVTDPGGSFGPGDITHLIDRVTHLKEINPVIHRPGGDPGPMRLELSEDANIDHVLSGPSTVRYGSSRIGQSGGLGNQLANAFGAGVGP